MNILAKIFKKIQTKRVIGALRDNPKAQLTRIGSRLGGWHLPFSMIPAGGTAVCVGAGEDISFDVELNKLGLKVFTLDPTPRAKDHVRQVLTGAGRATPVAINHSVAEHYELRGFDRSRFTFVEAGLWDQDKVARFFAPKDPSHVSHSIVNLQGTDEGFEARCMRLQTFCSSFQIGQPDILKLDVEGAEYAVLKDMARSGFRPKMLCVDFDEGHTPLDRHSMRRIAEAVTSLKRLGYQFWHQDGWNFLFVFAQ